MNNHDFLIAIGNNIREHRRRQNITILELAKMCSIYRNSLNNMELGKSAARVDNINRIANALNIQPHELLMFGGSQAVSATHHIQVDGTKPIQINLSIHLTPP